MNTQTAIWICVGLTVLIFVIEVVQINQLKRAVKQKLEWEAEK